MKLIKQQKYNFEICLDFATYFNLLVDLVLETINFLL